MLLMDVFRCKLLIVVVLSISLSTLVPVEGLHCYTCNTDDKSPNYDAECHKNDPEDDKFIRQCPDDMYVGCVFKTEFEERIVKRDCISKKWFDCAKKVFGMNLENGKCVISSSILTTAMWHEFGKCEGLKHLKPSSGQTSLAEEQTTAVVGTQDQDKSSITGQIEEEAHHHDPETSRSEDDGIIDGTGPGSRVDITKMEICFCTGDKCNDMKNVPATARMLDPSGVDTVKSVGLGYLILLAITLGFRF